MRGMELLEEFKQSSQHAERHSRLTEIENRLSFIESKFLKWEKVLRDTPVNSLTSASSKNKPGKTECGKCKDLTIRIEALLKSKKAQEEHYEQRFENSVNVKKAHYTLMETELRERKFLMKRIVAVYGNMALVDLLNHVDNPDLQHFLEEKKEGYLKINPHY